MTVAQSEGQPAGKGMALPEATIARIRELVAVIPLDDEAGGGDIYEQLLDATSIEELNAPWEAEASKKLAGRTITIRSVKQRPSKFSDGAGVFVVCEGADFKTGEAVTFTTSAVSVVIQLAKAVQLGMLPLTAEIVQADTPTASGYFPVHLKVLGAGGPGKAPF